MLDDFLTTNQFCLLHHVSPRTAERWRVTGDGPPFVRIGPRRVLYRTADAREWAARRTFQHRAGELARKDFERGGK